MTKGSILPFTMWIVTAWCLLPGHVSLMKYNNFQLQGLRDSRQGEASICLKRINTYRRWKGYQGARVSLLPGISPWRKQIIEGDSEKRKETSRLQTTGQTSRERISAVVFALSVFSSLCGLLHPCFSIQPDSSQLSPGEGTCTQGQTVKPQSYLDAWDISHTCAKAGTKQSRLVSHEPARPTLLAARRRCGTDWCRTISQHHHFCRAVSLLFLSID